MADQFSIPGLKEVIADIQKMNEGVNEAAKNLLNMAINSDKAMKSAFNNGGLKDSIDLQKKANETQKETKAVVDKLIQAEEKLKFAQSDLGKKIADVNLQTQKQNAENKNQAKSQDESRTALEKFNAKILESTRASKELGAQMALLAMDGKKNTQEYKDLEKAFLDASKTSKQLNDSYRDISKTAGDNRALVGSYSSELEGHFNMINDSVLSLKGNIASGNFAGAFGDARTIVKGFGDAVNKTKGESKDANAEMVKTGNVFSNIKAKANDAGKATVEFFKPAEQHSAQMTQGLERIKIGFTKNNEAVNDLRTSQTAGNAVGETTNSINQKGGVFSSLYARAQLILAGSTGIASAAFNILKVAIASTGIGLIIIAVGLLVNGLSKLDPVMDLIEQATAGFGAGLDKASSIVVNFVKGITSIGDAFSKIGNLILHPIDSIKSFASEVSKTAVAVAKLKAAEQELGDLKNIYETRTKNIESQIKLDEIKLKNKKLSSAQEIEIEKRLTDNYARLTKMRDEINEKTNKDALESAKVTQTGKTKINQQLLENEIKTGELVYANYLLNAGKINQATFDKLKEAVNMKIDTNNKAAEDEERSMAKAEKASDRTEAGEEKRQKAKEDRAKKALDDEKKSFEFLISTKKLTLDNIISSYKQEENLESSNLAFVKSISLEKQAIADLERQKNKIGVTDKKDLMLIDQKASEEIVKIKKEESDALTKISSDKAKFDLEMYDFNNKTLLNGAKDLTDLLIDQERKRAEESFKIHTDALKKELKIDEDRLNAKIKNGKELTKVEFEYIKNVKALETQKNTDIRKGEELILNAKLKAIADENKSVMAKFKFFTGQDKIKQVAEFKLMDAKLKKDKDVLKADQKNLKQGTKEYYENAKAIQAIDNEIASNKESLEQAVVTMKEDNINKVLNLITMAAGSESKIGKAVAIAMITMETVKQATKAFAIASVLAADPLTVALAPNAYLQGGLIIASGALQAAQVAGVKFFATGTDNAPYTGKAVVDELGAEIHTDAYGRIKSFGSDAGAHLTDIVKGDKIIPADISAMIKASLYAKSMNQTQTIDYAEMGRYFDKSAAKIVNAVNANGKNQLNVHVQRNITDRVMFKGRKV